MVKKKASLTVRLAIAAIFLTIVAVPNVALILLDMRTAKEFNDPIQEWYGPLSAALIVIFAIGLVSPTVRARKR